MRRYGWHPSLPDVRDRMMQAQPIDFTKMPLHVDLRDKMPPVYDQGSLGSCTANATGAAIEYERIKDGQTRFMPSRIFQYYNTRYIEGTADQDSGGTIRDAVKAAASYGVVPETLYPYDIKHFAVKPPAEIYAEGRECMLKDYRRIPQSLNHMQLALAQGFPIIFGFSVYESFESDQVARTGNMPMPNAEREAMVGGHAVLAVGYDGDERVFYVRNSWGPKWGMDGYFKMPMDFIGSRSYADDFWVLNTFSS